MLLNPDLSPEELEQIKQKYLSVIEQMAGRLIRLDDWGRRTLAYPVKKQTRGFYCLLDFMGQPALLAELERQMRLDERLFKFLTLVLDKEFSEEKFQRELERISAEKARREAGEPEEEESEYAASTGGESEEYEDSDAGFDDDDDSDED